MRRDIKTILFFTITAVLMVVIIGFTGVKNTGKQVNDVIVEIHDQNGDFFTDQTEILNLINAENTDYVLGLSVKELNLKELERRVEANAFVKDAQIYRDIKGNLLVQVEQARPIARIYNPHGPDQYIDMDGTILPTNSRHTARVPIVEFERSFSWQRSLTETDYGMEILALLNYIEKDEFWRAQIAQLVIEKDGELTLLPQVTKQEIKFGMPENLDTKFRKLKVFYKEILPNKGWNTYSLVNLKFENQIVCE
ncbi:MAG: cell division protein FtsQ [Marinoscillum sp.]